MLQGIPSGLAAEHGISETSPALPKAVLILRGREGERFPLSSAIQMDWWIFSLFLTQLVEASKFPSGNSILGCVSL